MHKHPLLTPRNSSYNLNFHPLLRPSATITNASRTNTKSYNLPLLTPRLLLSLSATILLMAFTMPSFLNRLMRPFSTSTMLGLAPGEVAPISNPDGAQKATIAAGCFWGVEHMYRKEFKNKGLYDARVGYIGGNMENPSYRAVCSGRTGRECFLF